MNKFNENLAQYQRRTGYTDKELLDKCGLTPCELGTIKSAKNCMECRPLLIKFCLNLEIRYQSLCDDNGFQYGTVIDQYEAISKDFKSMVTSVFFNQIDAKYGKDRILDLNIMSNAQFNHRSSGKCVLTKDTFQALCSGLPYLDFESLLGNIMFTRIPNFNFKQGKKILKFPNQVVSEILQLSNPTFAGKWTYKNNIPITSNYISTITALCTNDTSDEMIDMFTTQVLPSKYFILGTYILPKQNIVIPDPPSSKSSGVTLDEVMIDPEETLKETPYTSDNSFLIDESLVFKMFSKLSNKDKQEVFKLIYKLFEAMI